MRDFYDIVVVGGGHSGVEAAFSAHKFGLSVALVSKSKKSLGRMSCNPSIGGLAKSRVVREVDALGGVLPRAADMSAIQYRVLNRRKGPAVQSTRAQCDRKKYELSVQKILDENSDVAIIEGSASELIIEDGKIVGVVLSGGERIGAEAVVLATGTFLGGKIFIGDVEYPGGRIDENAETGLSESLKKMGLKILRFKTGTPPRIDGRTINYDNVRIQPGEEDYVPFSFDTMRKIPVDEQVPCYITYTTERTHRIIEKNLLKSALYGGKIVGIGPRYCPSIEVKVEKFPHHPRHIVFLEPEGIDTDEFYPNGVSNSLPEEVQLEMLRSIPGLEDVEMTKPGYAVEYDVVDPTQVLPTLELRDYKKIFLAGQILGTSGYEEAAGLGLLAGTNAALSVLGKDMITLPRYASYTGVMVDDLVFRGADEPYRLLTGRSEFRLLLREDNAWLSMVQVIPKSVFSVLASENYEKYERWRKDIERVKVFVGNTGLSSKQAETLDVPGGTKLADYLRRPDADWKKVLDMFSEISSLEEIPARTFRIEMKYSGYIARQLSDARELRKLEFLEIPENFDFLKIGLRSEAVEKFLKKNPRNIREASRIPGITPSDIAVLVGAIRKMFNDKQ